MTPIQQFLDRISGAAQNPADEIAEAVSRYCPRSMSSPHGPLLCKGLDCLGWESCEFRPSYVWRRLTIIFRFRFQFS